MERQRPDNEPSASGGGASVYFAKPVWQTGAGVPNDGMRDVPDVALSASADHDSYFVYTQGKLQSVGGTSVGVPVFAGLAALSNQRLGGGLGNINPTLYSLAKTSASAFHDITVGDNMITPTCNRGPSCASTTAVGFSAGVGYDQVTGLGSVNVSNLFAAWPTATSTTETSGASPTIAALVNAASFQAGYAPGEIVSVFGTGLAASAESASSVPLPDTLGGVSASINGVEAPLYYVSPGQINLQVPYAIAAGTTAVLTVTYNGLSATYAFTAGVSAPGIFTDASSRITPETAIARLVRDVVSDG